jgi:transposase
MSDLPADYQKHADAIADMDAEQIGRLMRFAPIGHPYMDGSLPYWELLNSRFQSLGGWTPQLSKQIGWN